MEHHIYIIKQLGQLSPNANEFAVQEIDDR